VSPEAAQQKIPKLIVPAYFHPLTHPREWASLVQQAPHIDLVVLNPDSGPSAQCDPAFIDALAPMSAAGVAVAGYVDTNYGARPPAEVLADIGRYQDWYGVTSVFFDRSAAGAEQVSHYASLTDAARQMGTVLVAYNHGVHPVQAYADQADLLGTFEGTWRTYLEAAVPRWVRSRPAAQFFHLVYSVPRHSFGDAYWLASRRNAGLAYVTDHGGDNPWDRLPEGEIDPDELWAEFTQNASVSAADDPEAQR
jgi:hypothetical protein